MEKWYVVLHILGEVHATIIVFCHVEDHGVVNPFTSNALLSVDEFFVFIESVVYSNHCDRFNTKRSFSK